MYKVGDEVKYISGMNVKGIKVRHSKVLEVTEDDKGVIIALQNAMKLRFVSSRKDSSWDIYRLIANGSAVLVKNKD